MRKKRTAVIEKEGELHKLTLSEHYDDDNEIYYYSIEFHRKRRVIYDIKGANNYFDKLLKKHNHDKKRHHKLPMMATPSVWSNPTEACVSGNAGVLLVLRTIWRSLRVSSNNLLG